MLNEDKVKYDFGNALREIRKSQGYSQEDLSEKTGLHRTYISDVERGDRNIALINIVKVCNALSIKPSAFFSYMEKGEE